MSENILCVKNIKKSFGGVHAFKGVDLTIKKGETHCLAGENGCGKSTIIKEPYQTLFLSNDMALFIIDLGSQVSD